MINASLKIKNQPRLSDLLRMIDADTSLAFDPIITGVANDSRRVRPGYLFIAASGATGHGSAYIRDAVARGAVAVFVDGKYEADGLSDGVALLELPDLDQQLGRIGHQFFGKPSDHLNIIACTGTDGKTTVCQLLSQVLPKCGLIGTEGAGFLGQLQPLENTTPGVLLMHQLLAEMLNDKAQYVAMEASSHGIDQGRLQSVHLDTAIFTNLGRDHLDYHGSHQHYAAAKKQLFGWPGLKHAIINADDPVGQEIMAVVPSDVEVVSYGLTQGDVIGHIRELTAAGIEVDVETPWGAGRMTSALIGRFNVSNLLAVLSCLLVHGVALEEALQRIAKCQPIAGRFEKLERLSGQPTVIIDYAHNPNSLTVVLDTVKEMMMDGHASSETTDGTAPKLVCVFGCGGDRDQGKRAMMGRIASERCDAVIITDDNPRSENPTAIVEQIMSGVDLAKCSQVGVIHDRAVAIQTAIVNAGSADIVVVAGKGNESYQITGEQTVSFSDRDVALDALRSIS